MSDAVLRELLATVPPPRSGRRGEGLPAQPVTSSRRRKCSYELPAGLVREFRVLCALQEVKQREVVEELIRSFVERHRHQLP